MLAYETGISYAESVLASICCCLRSRRLRNRIESFAPGVDDSRRALTIQNCLYEGAPKNEYIQYLQLQSIFSLQKE